MQSLLSLAPTGLRSLRPVAHGAQAPAGLALPTDGIAPEVRQRREEIHRTTTSTVARATLRHESRLVRCLAGAALWPKIYLLDTCSGQSLAAALIRLKVPIGVARAATNVNFTESSYAERAGLTGNGSSQYLNLGVSPSALGFSEADFSAFVYLRADFANNQAAFGSFDAVRTKGTWIGLVGGVRRGLIATAGTGEESGFYAAGTVGFIGVSANGSRACQRYVNGLADGAANTTSGTFASGSFGGGSFFKHALNQTNGAVANYSVAPLATLILARGLSAGEARLLAGAVADFERNLGRAVV